MLAVSEYTSLHYRPSIEVGDSVYIGRYAYFVACDKIKIGDRCVLSDNVYVTDLSHGYDPRRGPILGQDIESKGPVIIGENCFLGYRTAIMSGVTLGEWCIVGANSVVTKSFPAYSMVAGAPAKIIKSYSHKLERWVATDALEYELGD
jgi:acetyltransferase-like isoleucine patch superfamily enzyme